MLAICRFDADQNGNLTDREYRVFQEGGKELLRNTVARRVGLGVGLGFWGRVWVGAWARARARARVRARVRARARVRVRASVRVWVRVRVSLTLPLNQVTTCANLGVVASLLIAATHQVRGGRRWG